MTRFQREDPTFTVQHNQESEEIIVSGMGELHLFVYCERIKREYGVEIIIGNPTVNYIGIDIKGARFWRGAKTAVDTGLNNVAFVRTQIELKLY